MGAEKLEEFDKMLDVKELSALIKVSKSTIYRMVNDKAIPVVKIGNKRLFVLSDIRKWLEAQKVKSYQ
ncbi:helix-turn-helix transcriptional regulator [Kangiella sp.]|uniref:helix-turn-helix transcriptional regulator n=1 Tax=Kangiella sp. TaxID=1920245 RepID=UPI003A8EBB02